VKRMGKKTLSQEQRKSDIFHMLRHITIISLTCYLTAILLFYFLAGEQLHLRDSRGNFSSLSPESGTVELAVGNIVQQKFTVKIQRLEQVSIQWGTYYRQNKGTILVELKNISSGQCLLSQIFDASVIKENDFITLTAKDPLEGVYQVPLILSITSDGYPGSSPSPMMNHQQMEEISGELLLNGNPVEGTLCFSVQGTDYIWTGIHYWKFAAAGFVLLIFLLAAIWHRWKNGKRSYIINTLVAIQKYRFLIRQLVARDFKTKYKRSVLGMFWSFLNPLLTMSVQYFVFSTLFRSDIPNYPAYLLIGIVTFNFFSESCSMALSSVVGNAGLITKVYMPKYIYPLTRVISSVINLGISLIPLLLVSFLTGIQFHRSALLSFYFLICVIIFSLGLGLLLSSAMVFFRDTQFLWGVLSMIWMYATPIFYPESILPDNFKIILRINPMYHFLKNIRICILDGISPEPVVYIQCLLIALIALTIGLLIFYKSQDRFVLYL